MSSGILVRGAIVRLIALVVALPIVGSALAAEHDALVMGVFPRRNMNETIALFAPLADYLARELKRPVVVESARDFNSFWDGVATKRYDLVHFNQYHYVKAQKLYGYTAIIKNEEQGSSSVNITLVARAGSGIRTVADLRGKTVIFGGGREAMQSYIVATHLLRKAGLQAGAYTETFALNPPNAILAMFRSQADATSVTPTCLQESTEANTVSTVNLATSARYAHLPWAVKGTLSAELRQTIHDAMLRLNKSTEGREILAQARVTGFASAHDREYDAARALIREVLREHY